MNNCPNIHHWHRDVSAPIRLPVVLGAGILALCIGGSAVWSFTAPLDGAVVVSGSFVATGQNKHVQHLEGGILREILIREGDLVEADQPLLRLDPTPARAKLQRLVVRSSRLRIMKARLEAEIKGERSFSLPPDLVGEVTDSEIQEIAERQRVELRVRRSKLEVEENVFRKEIAGLRESIGGFTAQARSTKQRLSLFAEELQDKQRLLALQLARRSDILAIQRAEAALGGEAGELEARVADARQRVARAQQQIAQLRSAALQKALEELRVTETELDDLQEQIRAARDVMDRVEVRAPVRGIVVKLNQRTPGGVVAAGAVILELLPVNDELIIEARLNPSDIWHVKTGQRALVRLTALNQRLTPMIDGTVTYLSADALAVRGDPEATQHAAYVVRVRLSDADVKSKVEAFQPTPGMPADVFIKTGERTFFDYIMRPVFDSFDRAFREQ